MMNIKNIFSWKNAGRAGKVAIGLSVPTALLIGYYIFDRKFIKEAPLFPFNLDKAREKQAQEAMMVAEKKLKTLMDERRINGFGVRKDEETEKYYIEVGSNNVNDELKGRIPAKVGSVPVRLVQREMALAVINK